MCTCRPSHNHKVNMSNRSMSSSITKFRQTVLQNIFSKAIPSEQLFPPTDVPDIHPIFRYQNPITINTEIIKLHHLIFQEIFTKSFKLITILTNWVRLKSSFVTKNKKSKTKTSQISLSCFISNGYPNKPINYIYIHIHMCIYVNYMNI
jgi:hypothetical protein